MRTITATNLCPPNWAQDSNNGGWCNPPRTHFDMAKPAFMKIAQWKAGIVLVMYQRACVMAPRVVPCNGIRKGGIRFSFQGNGYWILVYVMNVVGAGNIHDMAVKGTKTRWISMSHNWGASYQAFATLKGQALSFRLTSYTTKQGTSQTTGTLVYMFGASVSIVSARYKASLSIMISVYRKSKESASIVRNCNSFSSVADCSLTSLPRTPIYRLESSGVIPRNWPDENWEELPIEFCEDDVDGFEDDD
ncbi:expansin-A7-like protein [Tanacetum coccineum]